MPSEVHCRLHCPKCVQLKAVVAVPDGQPFSPTSVCGLTTISYVTSDTCVVRKPQGLNRGGPLRSLMYEWGDHEAPWHAYASCSGGARVSPASPSTSCQ